MADEATLFNARVDPRTVARPGGTLTLAVDPAHFQFFDPTSGTSLLANAPTLTAVE